MSDELMLTEYIRITSLPEERRMEAFEAFMVTKAFATRACERYYFSRQVSNIISFLPKENRVPAIERFLLHPDKNVRSAIKFEEFLAPVFKRAGWADVTKIMGVKHPDGYKINAYCSPSGAVVMTGGCFVGSPEALAVSYTDRPKRQKRVQGRVAKAFAKSAKDASFTPTQQEGLERAATALKRKPWWHRIFD